MFLFLIIQGFIFLCKCSVLFCEENITTVTGCDHRTCRVGKELANIQVETVVQCKYGQRTCSWISAQLSTQSSGAEDQFMVLLVSVTQYVVQVVI